MAISNVINFFLDPLLIFGYGPIPAMGVDGSAWATVIARVLGIGYLLVRMRGIRIPGVAITSRSFAPDAGMIRRLAMIGFFASSQMLMRNIAAIAMMRFVKPFGADAQAAYTIVVRLWFITLGIGINYGIAASIMVGQNIGANQMARAEKSAWLTAAYFSIATIAASVFAYIFDEALVAVFQTEPEVVRIGSLMIQWLLWTLPFMGFSVVLTRALNGAGDTRSALIMTALPILILQIPLAYYLSNHWPFGTPQNINGIFAAFAVSVVIQAMMMTYAFRSGRWKTIGARHRDADNPNAPSRLSASRSEKNADEECVKPSDSQSAARTDRTRPEEHRVLD
jgi:putative MATE family efflux protein